MPKRPAPLCIECDTPIPEWNGRGSRPLFCGDREKQCRLRYKLHEPWCARPGCRKPYKRSHISQHFCSDQCRFGCHYCGQKVEPETRTKQKDNREKTHHTPAYCSYDCLQMAWENVPPPKCNICKQPQDPLEGQVRANQKNSEKPKPCYDPPSICRKCWDERFFRELRNISWRTKASSVMAWQERSRMIQELFEKLRDMGFDKDKLIFEMDRITMEFHEHFEDVIRIHNIDNSINDAGVPGARWLAERKGLIFSEANYLPVKERLAKGSAKNPRTQSKDRRGSTQDRQSSSQEAQ